MARLPKVSLKGLIPRWTIRGRIVLAFSTLGAITVVLGIFAVQGADRSALLVRDTYDETVIATSYARAAAADFANMRAGYAHEVLSPDSRRDVARQMSSALEASFETDLSTAVEKSSADTRNLGNTLREAVAAWAEATRRVQGRPSGPVWDDLERRSRKVEELLEQFVSRVSDRGYAFREEAQAAMGRDVRTTTLGVVAALGIAGLVALMLYLRISAPIGAAARFANEIAAGTLDGSSPQPGSDEIGDLIRAMVGMRSDIGAMMGEQVILRERSQARVAEALDGSREGVIIADAQGVIQIVNRRALDFLDLAEADVAPGLTLPALRGLVARGGNDRTALLVITGDGPESEETLLPDGRWVQNSRNRTSEGGLVALYTDISSSRDQRDRLADANATLDAALGNMSQGLCVFDAENCLRLANSRFAAMFGPAATEIAPGASYESMVARAVRLTTPDAPDDAVQRIVRFERKLSRRRRSGTRSATVGSRIIAVTQEPMPDGGWIATYEDVTERRHAEERVNFLANHDALTSLPNRTLFAQRVEEALVRARRGLGFAVLCLDLDRFKVVNDTLGHAMGDHLLQAASQRLLACVRETDTVARLGGDEFAILQADVMDPLQVVPLARRIVNAIAAPFIVEGQSLNVGVSIGVALSPGDGQTHGLLLKGADAALYKAKEDGRGTWRFFEAAMDEKLQARRALEADLRHAIVQNEFEVHYQPLLDVASGRIGCLEALVRWRHPTRGLIPPDQFIPVAEETGLIREIGVLVLRAACREAGRWPVGTRVAVNVSAVQLRDAGFVQTVTDALRDMVLAPGQLELEITESVLMANHAKVIPILTALRDAGVRFAMDDFGTGYSSLGTLRTFPFDKLKIDRSFVRDLGTDEAAGQIIRTILALGGSLGIHVTAEGVETAEQMQALTAMGCSEIQGYFVGRPAPAASLPALFAAFADRAAAAALAA